MDLKSFFSSWVDAHREDLIHDISRLVKIKSVKGTPESGKPFGPGPAAALDQALKMAEEYGFTVRNYDGYAGTADLNNQPTALDILCHLDVVSEGTGWETDPYTAVEKNGMLYGRGTDDDKGPTAAILLAMRAVRESGIRLAHNARLIMGTDEESGSEDLPYYFAREHSAPNTFSPDASFPVYNTERGFYRPKITREWKATDVLPRVSGFEGGFRLNVIPEVAEATVLGVDEALAISCCAPEAEALGVALTIQPVPGGVKFHVKGVGAHAAEPDTGNNGITALIRILLCLPLAECACTHTLHQINMLLPHGDYSAVALGMDMKDEISGPLTLSFTLMQITETGFSGSFDSRIPMCATQENCKNVAERRFKDCGFCISGEMEPAHHTPGDSRFVKTLLTCYEHYTGLKGECLSMGGGTYVHDIPGGVAFGAGMPGFKSNLHSANEHISIENMLTAAKIYAAAIAELCAG